MYCLEKNSNNIVLVNREMNLSLNKIRRLPNDFGLIHSLEILNLSHNMISELPKSVGNLTRLRVLNLAHNNVKKIQDELMLMCALESLNLANNILPSFPYALCRLPKLTVLVTYIHTYILYIYTCIHKYIHYGIWHF